MSHRLFSLLVLFACPVAGEETNWSLAPLTRVELPATGEASPIDAFIVQGLRGKGLALSPPADRRSWLRRVSFDLVGLPPTPGEIQGFLEDAQLGAKERVVDRLLASPRHGERWARHWMDVVRYAETHGHDEDAIRENAWPYRDWLIRALNEDKPYAEFIREQVAGDVITDDPRAVAATGFLACGPWDSSSQMGIKDGTIDKKVAQYLDRDDMLSATLSTFTSTTVHCARCHDHKFDPISTEDYYALQAVFAGIDKVDRPFEADPELRGKRVELTTRQAQLKDGTYPAEELDHAELRTAAAAWARQLRERDAGWKVLPIIIIHSAQKTPHEVQPDGSIRFGGTAPQKDSYTLTAPLPGKRISAVQVEVLTDPSFPVKGPGRAPNGNLHLSEISVSINGKAAPIKTARADFNQAAWEVDKAIDGNMTTAWGIHPQEGQPHRAVFVLADPVETKEGAAIEVVLHQQHGGSHLIGRPRISISAADDPQLGEALPPELATVIAIPEAERSATQQRMLSRAWLVQETERRLAALPAPGTVFAVASRFAAKGNFKPAGTPREVQVLKRGDIHSPAGIAQPGTLSCLPGLPARFELPADDEGARRAALANWLSHPGNVLTWRSLVNRVWHYHFGRGIVDTPNDLGKMGGTPSHPELLDWLALEFRDGGGHLKDLHKRIVLSKTYGQSAGDRPEGLGIDADNRLLWRMNRGRLDAESIRDAVLSLSGKLDLTMGGPSARHFHSSKGIHVTPKVEYLDFDPDDPANFRRSVYRFVFRTVPDPLMQALDCPDASLRADRRESSTTALQALAMMNNRFMLRQSAHIAARLEQSGGTLETQVNELFLRAYARPASDTERDEVVRYARAHGLANACRVIINSSEFLFVQ